MVGSGVPATCSSCASSPPIDPPPSRFRQVSRYFFHRCRRGLFEETKRKHHPRILNLVRYFLFHYRLGTVVRVTWPIHAVAHGANKLYLLDVRPVHVYASCCSLRKAIQLYMWDDLCARLIRDAEQCTPSHRLGLTFSNDWFRV